MQVRVSPNYVFKQTNTAWLKRAFCLAASLPVARLNGLRYLMPKKRGSRILPQSSPHMNVNLFSLKTAVKQDERLCLTNIF